MGILTLILTTVGVLLFAYLTRTRPTPTHCACGRPADVIDDARPWIVRCARCHLRKSGLL